MKPAAAVPASCTECGLCCWSDDPCYLGVFAIDEARMGARSLRLTRQRDGQRFMRLVRRRCAALAPGEAPQRWRCTIYPERPDCCRWLERGSGACREQIAAKAALAERATD